MGGVIFVNALNIEDKVSIVVILIVTRPIIIIDLYTGYLIAKIKK